MGVNGDKALLDATHTKERAEFCKCARAFHVLEAFGVCLCCTELVRRDGVAEEVPFGCKPVAIFCFNSTSVALRVDNTFSLSL